MQYTQTKLRKLSYIIAYLRSNQIVKEQALQNAKRSTFDQTLTDLHFSGVGGAREDRTPDLLRARQALSQLSYGP